MLQQNNQNNTLFRDLAEQWISLVGTHAKESTIAKYRNILDNHLIPKLGAQPIQTISTASVEDFALQKLQTGRLDGRGGLSPKTVKDMLGIIREVIQYAENREISTTCNIKNIHIKLPQNTSQPMNKEDQYKLVTFLMNNESPRNIGILISLYMGLRIGELCALRWEDILLGEQMIRIRHTMQRIQNFPRTGQRKTKVIITTPKSSCSIREIPIPGFLVDLLKKQSPESPDVFLLTNQVTSYLEPRLFQYYFRRLLIINELPIVNYHALRHTFATRCIEAGFDLKSLSEILGHSTVNITLNRYVHSSMEMKRQNMKKLDYF